MSGREQVDVVLDADFLDARDTTSDVGLALETAPYYELQKAEAEKILRRARNVVRTWRQRARALRLPREETELMSGAFRDA